jgi:hypothetical protein
MCWVSGAQWPEPIAILLMMSFTFIGAAAAYRAGGHIAVTMLTDRLPAALQAWLARAVHLLMLVVCGCSWWSTAATAVLETMGQTVAELPWLPVGVTYLAIPAGRPGHCTVCAGAPVCRLAETPRRGGRSAKGADMDTLVLLGSFFVLMMLGMPVAYALGLSAWWARSGSTCRWTR